MSAANDALYRREGLGDGKVPGKSKVAFSPVQHGTIDTYSSGNPGNKSVVTNLVQFKMQAVLAGNGRR